MPPRTYERWESELPLASQGAAWGVCRSSPALSPGSRRRYPLSLGLTGYFQPALTAVTSLHHTTSKYLTYHPPPLYPQGLASNGKIKEVGVSVSFCYKHVTSSPPYGRGFHHEAGEVGECVARSCVPRRAGHRSPPPDMPAASFRTHIIFG